jgi:ATP phosphoribosyltransferase regulatory subunit
MQAPQPSISGTRDYAGDDAVALQAARDAIEATLRRYAYAAIDPPILESSAPFLNRSGEDIRRQMYIFPDPAGQEVCLRPELTIPVCRAYLRQRQSSDGVAREARLSYFGPAFTYESASDGRYRQFYQAGAEFIGASSREAADAEILAAALDALKATGLKETSVEIGDVDIRNAFIDQLPVSERSKARIRRVALRSQKETHFISAASAQESAAAEKTDEFGELASLLASVEPGKAELLIKEVFALADVRHVGGRTPEEIVERLISRTQQEEPISAKYMQGVLDLLKIRAKPEAAFKAIRDHFRKFEFEAIEPILERCETRLSYFNAYGQNPAALYFNVGLRRGLEYYTGFLFEVSAKNLAQIGHVCGGGRYDNLLEGLGANASIPAVGFGIGLDQLLLALQKADAPSRDASAPQALVVAEEKGRHADCIRVSTLLREAGWSVELELSGRSERDALAYAAKHNVPYAVFVGDSKGKKDALRVRRLDERTDRPLTFADLQAYARSESAAVAEGKTS